MVFERVVRIICDLLELDENEIFPETSIVDDLGADSVQVYEIFIDLEDEFDLDIPDEDAEELRTVSDIVGYIEERI